MLLAVMNEQLLACSECSKCEADGVEESVDVNRPELTVGDIAMIDQTREPSRVSGPR